MVTYEIRIEFIWNPYYSVVMGHHLLMKQVKLQIIGVYKIRLNSPEPFTIVGKDGWKGIYLCHCWFEGISDLANNWSTTYIEDQKVLTVFSYKSCFLYGAVYI